MEESEDNFLRYLNDTAAVTLTAFCSNFFLFKGGHPSFGRGRLKVSPRQWCQQWCPILPHLFEVVGSGHLKGCLNIIFFLFSLCCG